MMFMPEVITIDGPAGSGKSTVSRMLAQALDFFYLDTGAMYRAVALAALRREIPLDDGPGLRELCRTLDLHFRKGDPPRLFLGQEDISSPIRSPDMDILSSNVSAVGEVRKAMTDLQRQLSRDGNLVAEGRDMGTVVFPRARHKFFLTASVEARAERRFLERLGRGEAITREAVEEDLRKRDHQDETRRLAPLRPAEDAEIIDSTLLSPHEVVRIILQRLDPAVIHPPAKV